MLQNIDSCIFFLLFPGRDDDSEDGFQDADELYEQTEMSLEYEEDDNSFNDSRGRKRNIDDSGL